MIDFASGVALGVLLMIGGFFGFVWLLKKGGM